MLTSVNDVAEIQQLPGQSDTDFLESVLKIVLDELDKSPLFARNAILVKIASILYGLLDGNKEKEHVYDTHIQMAIANAKM